MDYDRYKRFHQKYPRQEEPHGIVAIRCNRGTSLFDKWCRSKNKRDRQKYAAMILKMLKQIPMD